MQLIFTDRPKIRYRWCILYPQVICNDSVFSAVSFQINLGQSPAMTLIPSGESFVLESLFHLFWKACFIWMHDLQQSILSCYLCRNVLLPLGCALQPVSLPLTPSSQSLLATWRSLLPGNHCSTNNSCQWRPCADCGCKECITEIWQPPHSAISSHTSLIFWSLFFQTCLCL